MCSFYQYIYNNIANINERITEIFVKNYEIFTHSKSMMYTVCKYVTTLTECLYMLKCTKSQPRIIKMWTVYIKEKKIYNSHNISGRSYIMGTDVL